MLTPRHFAVVCATCAFLVGLVSWYYIPPNLLAAYVLYGDLTHSERPAQTDQPSGRRHVSRADTFYRNQPDPKTKERTAVYENQSKALNSSEERLVPDTQQSKLEDVHNTHMPVPSSGRLRDNTSQKLKDKFLIWECTSRRTLCGGWSDRQRGIVFVFLLANLTNRRFGIRMSSPCDLRTFFLPNEYNWTVSNKEMNGASKRHIIIRNDKSFPQLMSVSDFNEIHPEDAIFLNTNMDPIDEVKSNPHYRDILPPWAKQSKTDVFRQVWGMLMKLAPDKQQRLDSFLQSVHYFNRSHPLVGVHVRTRRNAEFLDAPSKYKPIDSLWDFIQPYMQNGSDVFVATDNLQVRKASLTKFGSHHHDTGAVLRHIDRQRGDPNICQGF
ncbi:uncharacterized protein LOC143285834 [Babylonia areolata]|uniref:uncharacterized protein LOC143285834 n=1 Tax=Babylonia areolata TaxID=304850 RepID=UPI003FD4B339